MLSISGLRRFLRKFLSSRKTNRSVEAVEKQKTKHRNSPKQEILRKSTGNGFGTRKTEPNEQKCAKSWNGRRVKKREKLVSFYSFSHRLFQTADRQRETKAIEEQENSK